MKKATIFLFLVLGSLFFTSATMPHHTEPDKETTTKPEPKKAEDLSEYCKPDWSGYDTLSPDISTRRFLYPTAKEKKQANKKAKKVKKEQKVNFIYTNKESSNKEAIGI